MISITNNIKILLALPEWIGLGRLGLIGAFPEGTSNSKGPSAPPVKVVNSTYESKLWLLTVNIFGTVPPELGLLKAASFSL